jgi:anti-sigma B factor antagonist
MDRGQHAQADGIPVSDQGDLAVTDMFSVSSERHDGALGIIILVGEVDIYTAAPFKERMLELLDGGVEKLLVDLSGVTFIDSTALGVLIGGLRRVHDAGGMMALVVTTSVVERVLTITGLDRVFEIHATRAAAIEALA